MVVPTTIGVLALQGSFRLHKAHVEAAGGNYVEITEPKDLNGIDGLILPGGESGVMLKLIREFNMDEPLARFLECKPCWGICAGAILMAKTVLNPNQKSFGAMNFTIERNAYGRQLESLEGIIQGYKVSYIRAPKIIEVGTGINILSKHGNNPSWIEEGQKIVTTFHPETNLMMPSPWHTRLIRISSLE